MLEIMLNLEKYEPSQHLDCHKTNKIAKAAVKINQATKDKMVHIWNDGTITSRDMLLFTL